MDLRIELIEKYFGSVENGLSILDGLFNVNRIEFKDALVLYLVGLKFDINKCFDDVSKKEFEFVKMYVEIINLDCRNLIDSYISLKGFECKDNLIKK